MEEKAITTTQKCEVDYPTVAPFFQLMQKLAENPDVPVDKLEKIVEMQERILDRNAKQEFNAAMVRAQSNMPIVPRDKKNNQTNSWYSKYETMLKFCKPIYTKEGFSILFHEGDSKKEDEIRIIAEVMHSGGHTKVVYTDIPIDNKGIKGTTNKTATHAKGSSIQYGRSYLMKQIFNIPSGDDDDGNAASIEYITEEQQNTIHAMIEENELGKNYLASFCKWLKVESLDKLPVKTYGMAIKGLNEAINQRKRTHGA